MGLLVLLPKQVDDTSYFVKDNFALQSLGWMEDGIVTQAAVRRVSRCDVRDCNFKTLILYQGEHAS